MKTKTILKFILYSIFFLFFVSSTHSSLNNFHDLSCIQNKEIQGYQLNNYVGEVNKCNVGSDLVSYSKLHEILKSLFTFVVSLVLLYFTIILIIFDRDVIYYEKLLHRRYRK